MSLPVIALTLMLSPAVVTEGHLVLAVDWARPRYGEAIVALQPVRDAVIDWMEDETRRLVVIHPGGEMGRIWGSELRDWLVSLGVPPGVIIVRPGSPHEDAVVLRLE